MSTLDVFRASLAGASPPGDAGVALQALWWIGKGDWEQAHRLAARHEDDVGCNLVHAHLHRVEGDAGNARYWYARSDRSTAHLPLDAEWDAIAAHLLPATGPER